MKNFKPEDEIVILDPMKTHIDISTGNLYGYQKSSNPFISNLYFESGKIKEKLNYNDKDYYYSVIIDNNKIKEIPGEYIYLKFNKEDKIKFPKISEIEKFFPESSKELFELNEDLHGIQEPYKLIEDDFAIFEEYNKYDYYCKICKKITIKGSNGYEYAWDVKFNIDAKKLHEYNIKEKF